MKYQLDLPLELRPYQDKIEASIRPYINILPQAKQNTEAWESKFGGWPYLPKNMEVPTGKNGRPLYLLAQINFSEIPDLPPFPSEGLLQFFIGDDRLYGADSKDPMKQENFHLRFFGSIKKNIPLIAPPSEFPEISNFPISTKGSFPLKFELRHEAAPLTDHRIQNFLEEDFFARFGEGKWEVMEAYSKLVHSGGHRLGGYSFFTQTDPRENHIEQMEQLLQIDSDQSIQSMWGDMGAAHFFIKKEALERRDFSKVAYWWDCY